MTPLIARLTIRAGRRRLDVELRIPAPAGRPHLTIRTGNRMGRTPDVRPENPPVLINCNRPAPPTTPPPPAPPAMADAVRVNTTTRRARADADDARPAATPRPRAARAARTLTFDAAPLLDSVNTLGDYQRVMAQQRARRTAR